MSVIDRKSIRLFKLTSCLMLGAAFLFPLHSFGVEQSIEQIPQPGFLDSVDAPHDYLSEKFIGFASYMDRFFGDDRNYQEGNKTVVQLDLTRATGYGGDNKIVLSGRAKLVMPMTERKLNLLLETDPEQNITSEKTKAQPTTNKKVISPKSVALAARYEKVEESLWHFSADAGIQFRGLARLPNPFARERGSYSVPIDAWRLKATQSVFWFNTIGAGISAQLDLERPIIEPILFRASSTGTWLKESENTDLRQDFSFYHTVNERTALLYQTSVIVVSRPQWQVTDYVFSMACRYRLHREWMFVEISPQLHFPLDMNYRISPSFVTRLEMLFDETR